MHGPGLSGGARKGTDHVAGGELFRTRHQGRPLCRHGRLRCRSRGEGGSRRFSSHRHHRAGRSGLAKRGEGRIPLLQVVAEDLEAPRQEAVGEALTDTASLADPDKEGRLRLHDVEGEREIVGRPEVPVVRQMASGDVSPSDAYLGTAFPLRPGARHRTHSGSATISREAAITARGEAASSTTSALQPGHGQASCRPSSV